MASKRRTPTTPPPEQAPLTMAQMRKGIEILKRRLDDVEKFDPNASDEVRNALQTSLGETLERVFGHGTRDYNRFINAAYFDHGPVSMDRGRVRPSRVPYIVEGKTSSLALLRQAIAMLEERILDTEPGATTLIDSSLDPDLDRSRVFIVHGRDAALKHEVARFIDKLQLEAVILDEQANLGMTVVEKFEKHGDVGFAIVLLTPDDVGALKGDTLRPRARQNVILELGYFYGKLKRENVCVLARGEDVERPSDIGGIITASADGNWKIAVAKDLRAAGYVIDMNVVI